MIKPFQTLLTTLVIAAHATLLLFYASLKAPASMQPKRLVVSTKIEQPFQTKSAAPAAMIEQPLKTAPAPRAHPPKPKKTAPPKPTPPAKRTAPQKRITQTTQKQPVKKNRPPPPPPKQKAVPENLLKELEESIAKIEKNDHKRNAKAPLTVPAISGEQEKSGSSGACTYHEKLISCLQSALLLPEHGEVTIQLELTFLGEVFKMDVLKATSEKNRSYLEKQLPAVRFPPFDGGKTTYEKQTFILTFCNEI